MNNERLRVSFFFEMRHFKTIEKGTSAPNHNANITIDGSFPGFPDQILGKLVGFMDAVVSIGR